MTNDSCMLELWLHVYHLNQSRKLFKKIKALWLPFHFDRFNNVGLPRFAELPSETLAQTLVVFPAFLIARYTDAHSLFVRGWYCNEKVVFWFFFVLFRFIKFWSQKCCLAWTTQFSNYSTVTFFFLFFNEITYVLCSCQFNLLILALHADDTLGVYDPHAQSPDQWARRIGFHCCAVWKHWLFVVLELADILQDSAAIRGDEDPSSITRQSRILLASERQ